MEIETDYETVEVASVLRASRKLRTCPECDEEFMPRYGNQVCCSEECREARHRRIDRECRRRARGAIDYCKVECVRRVSLAAERKEKARRRAEFFAARDAAFERAGLPIPKIEIRNGVRIENRGTIAWGGRTFSSNPSIRQAVNPSVLH